MYLARFHANRPGVTERALLHAADSQVGSAYAWLGAGLPDRLGEVLDVACGNAALHPVLADRCTSYLGLDVSEAELADARARGRGPVVRADARALPVADGSVDTVVSSMGLMLVRPIGVAIEEIARVLRPGGTAAVLVPAAYPVRLSDLPTLVALHRALAGLWSMPGRPRGGTLLSGFERADLRVVQVDRRRFAFPLRTAADAALAHRSLYAPGRSASALEAAEQTLVRRTSPGAELAFPLMRIVARRR